MRGRHANDMYSCSNLSSSSILSLLYGCEETVKNVDSAIPETIDSLFPELPETLQNKKECNDHLKGLSPPLYPPL